MTTDLPNAAATRMLLRSDGSTTLLLESMLNLKLDVKVIRQHTVSGDAVLENIRGLLHAGPEQTLFERHSLLVTPDERWVSKNYVVSRIDGIELLIRQMQVQNIPLGKLLASAKFANYRLILGFGKGSCTVGDSHFIAPFKHYVICGSEKCNPLIYVREQFNTDYVYLSDDDRDGTPISTD
jgi:chorismate-pyruvate lyase